MYFYSRSGIGDSHNDISTQTTTIQIYTFRNSELCAEVWGDLDYVSVLLNMYLN